MAVYEITNQEVKSSGDAIGAFIDALGSYHQVGIEIFARYGIIDPKPGDWYITHKVLKAYQEVEQKLGRTTIFSIGEKIPSNAVFPPEIDSIEKALFSINIAYHMNHSINSVIMFDPNTGTIQDGIGNYVVKILGDGEAEITSDTPYPTAFDEGIIFAIAQRFNEASLVTVQEDRSFRSKGGNEDVYLVQWF